MASIQTQGFRVNAMPQFTPVDPRYAVQDPTAMFRGIQGGMGLMRDIEADALLRQDRPRQQILRDIELAQAQAALESDPGQKRLKDLQLAEAERRFRIGALEPIAQGQPVRELDESGNLIQYQPTLDFNPTTGQPYDVGEKPAMDTSLIKTRQQMESEQRAMEALAQQRTASGEAALIRATTPRNTVKRAYDYANNRQVDEVRDAQGNVVEIRVVVDEQGREVPPPPRAQGAGGGGLEEMFGGTSTPGGTPIAGPSTPPLAPATITGTQAPANAVPDLQLAMPFNSEAEALQAAQLGLIVPGQRILINGRPAIWE